MVMLEMCLAAEGWTGGRHSHRLENLHNHSCSCRFHPHALGTRERAVLTVGLLPALLKFSSDASGKIAGWAPSTCPGETGQRREDALVKGRAMGAEGWRGEKRWRA